MNKLNALNAYKQTKIKTAGGGKLIVMLYDEAIKQMDSAIKLLEEENRKFDQINNAILKSQEIITELMASLDFEKGQDIAKNLFSLYIFFNQQLMNGNVKKDASYIHPVKKLMVELRDSWQQISDTPMPDGSGPDNQGGVSISG